MLLEEEFKRNETSMGSMGYNEEYEPSPIEEVDFAAEEDGTESISFHVARKPEPKGSTRSFYIKESNRVITTSSNKNLKEWEADIAHAAARANEARKISFYSSDKRFGYDVLVEFIFERPKSLPKRIKLNTKRPDLDKLVRAVLDGLMLNLIPDDSQVVTIQAKKRYMNEKDVGPGARITVKRLPWGTSIAPTPSTRKG